jgi:hypothetical protein
MRYNLVITTQARKFTQPQATKIQAQAIFESHIRDGVDFTIKVSKHVCEHAWLADRNYMQGLVDLTCDKCGEGFQLSDAVLTACHEGGAEAKKHGF